MNKIFCVIVCVLSLFPIPAQSQNQANEIQKLSQRVDSLEHELSYLNLSNELNTLNYDIQRLSNEVYVKYIKVDFDIYKGRFDSDLGKSLQLYYEAVKGNKQSISELMDAKKKFFYFKIATYPYTESERGVLWRRYEVIDGAYSNLEQSMNLLNIAVETYNKLCR